MDQLQAGLGMLTDGAVHQPGDCGPVEFAREVVDAWELAHGLLRRLVADGEDGSAEALPDRPPVAGVPRPDPPPVAGVPRPDPPPLKACLQGPYSLGLGTPHGRHGGPRTLPTGARRRRTLAAAEAVRAAAEGLFRAGAPVVQVCEDALTGIGVDHSAERELASEALRRATDGLQGHLSLSVTGGDAQGAGPALFFELPFASYLFDLVEGPDNWRLIARAPGDRGIICGVADARTVRRDDEPILVWAARYAASTRGRGPARVGLAPSRGLELLPRDIARRKLAALAEAARRAGLPDQELMAEIDPRAVDARSAAVGRYDPSAGPGHQRIPGQRTPRRR
jgi:hypothetical protein